jgi:ubiquinone/menaquinone biosynthesis C-methylase UbiE
MTSPYVYDQGWADERARLAGIEALWDRGSQELLARHGARPGASALEAGAGGGSIVSWLAAQVGPTGRVLAVDLDTRFVDALASDAVEIRRADVVADELPEGEFDLVHARLLLEHLPGREAALDRFVRALRPCGWLVVEDYDWTAFGFDPTVDVEQQVADAVITFMAQAGFDPSFGRRVTGALAARGLEDVHGEGRSLVIDAGHPGYPFFSLSFDQLAPAIVQAGLLSAALADGMRARLRAGERRVLTPTLVAAIGRKAGADPAV